MYITRHGTIFFAFSSAGSHSRPIYKVFTPNARPNTTRATLPIVRRRCSAEDSEPLDDRAPVRCFSPVLGSGGEKSRLGTLEGVEGAVSECGCPSEGGGGGGGCAFGGRGGGGRLSVAIDRNGCASARRDTDLLNTANIPQILSTATATRRQGMTRQKFHSEVFRDEWLWICLFKCFPTSQPLVARHVQRSSSTVLKPCATAYITILADLDS